MKLESPAFKHNHPIPSKYTCEGENISPPLIISEDPRGTQSFALILDDPDAPSGTFDHWIVWNLPYETKKLLEGTKVPMQGTNHFRKQSYGGPCPPPGSPHRYFFKVYALDTMLDLPKGSTKSQLEDAMEGHILGKAELVGTYQRQK
jgi:Raf kinase inhibitor-like YbhB/YbcL family protein